MIKLEMYDKDGNVLPEGSVMPDGGRMRVPHLLMDSATPPIIDTARHSPGGLAMSDADLDLKAAALDARDARLTSAWANPPAAPIVKTDAAATIPATTIPAVDLDALHARRHSKLQNSWRASA